MKLANEFRYSDRRSHAVPHIAASSQRSDDALVGNLHIVADQYRVPARPTKIAAKRLRTERRYVTTIPLCLEPYKTRGNI
jgi:hypothetical protein